MMDSQQLRRRFLQAFVNQPNRPHKLVSSSPVVPYGDPTILFTNAGMNQFKDRFLGKKGDYVRATSCQKCVRVGGKHNDLDNVGHTERHLTFFEMLGNFSFGDYFKQEAIAFAWQVSQEVFGFDPDRIYPTVYTTDQEAFDIWSQYVRPERITRMGKEDNFWSMGEVGPCGPCSELYYDRGGDFGAKNPAQDPEGKRFLEFWNLVFMERQVTPDGQELPLPKPSVDTGAGLERIRALQMGVDSVFETDILRALISCIEQESGVPYRTDNAASFHVIADHLRMLAFAIADGVMPSNLDRGYILRKVIRRAVRYAKALGFLEPFLARFIQPLVALMGSDYDELEKNRAKIEEVLTREEESFFQTLRRGGSLLKDVVDRGKVSGTIRGEDAFELKDTYGMPLEEIELFAKDSGVAVDLDTFKQLEQKARELSKKGAKTLDHGMEAKAFAHLDKMSFCGYDTMCCSSQVLGIRQEQEWVETLKEGDFACVYLDQSPFYAEKGGQIGDRGTLNSSEAILRVLDVKTPCEGVIEHHVEVLSGTLVVGKTLEARVDPRHREGICQHHTATHLLHWALREVLGTHVRQAGSVVEQERLRFDFQHHCAMTPQQLEEVEKLVNQKIRENVPVRSHSTSYESIKHDDQVLQFFGDKYDEVVRVVDIGFSQELCGGTHVQATGCLGLFTIVSERSIASGVRRIEALAGEAARQELKTFQTRLAHVSARLKTPMHTFEEKFEDLIARERSLTQQVAKLLEEKAQHMATSLQSLIVEDLLCATVALGAQQIKTLSEQLLVQHPHLCLFLISQDSGHFLIKVSDPAYRKGRNAREIMEQFKPRFAISGGGKPQLVQGVLQNPQEFSQALDFFKEQLLHVG